MISIRFLSLSFAVIAAVQARTLTINNHCSQPIWPGVFTASGPIVMGVGGEMSPGASLSAQAGLSWIGRLWARTGCDAQGNNCATGGCPGGLYCTATGAPPASLAEFTFDANGQDFYDLSLVDGFNLPISIKVINPSCKSPVCTADLNANCPAELRQVVNGQTVGCKSSCIANLSGDPANSPNCCSGQFSLPQTCPASGVQDLAHFKNGCPDAYSFAYDDNSALLTCPGQNDYTITFC